MPLNADTGGRYRATVVYQPPIVLAGRWMADNGYQTAGFPTKEEALAFCEKRWRIPAKQVRVLAPNDGSER